MNYNSVGDVGDEDNSQWDKCKYDVLFWFFALI